MKGNVLFLKRKIIKIQKDVVYSKISSPKIFFFVSRDFACCQMSLQRLAHIRDVRRIFLSVFALDAWKFN